MKYRGRHNVKSTIKAVLVIAGLLFMVGVVGGLEHDQCSIGTAIGLMAAGLAAAGIGLAI